MAAAVSKLKAISDKHGIALAEVAYRWLQWHSAMIPGDQGVILGASRVEQLEAAILSSYVFSPSAIRWIALSFRYTAPRDLSQKKW